jgi:hypothetical protein
MQIEILGPPPKIISRKKNIYIGEIRKDSCGKLLTMKIQLRYKLYNLR